MWWGGDQLFSPSLKQLLKPTNMKSETATETAKWCFHTSAASVFLLSGGNHVICVRGEDPALLVIPGSV